jgi:hypothetical protein
MKTWDKSALDEALSSEGLRTLAWYIVGSIDKHLHFDDPEGRTAYQDATLDFMHRALVTEHVKMVAAGILPRERIDRLTDVGHMLVDREMARLEAIYNRARH